MIYHSRLLSINFYWSTHFELINNRKINSIRMLDCNVVFRLTNKWRIKRTKANEFLNCFSNKWVCYCLAIISFYFARWCGVTRFNYQRNWKNTSNISDRFFFGFQSTNSNRISIFFATKNCISPEINRIIVLSFWSYACVFYVIN